MALYFNLWLLTMDENNKKTLELISIIIRLNNKININEYNKEITQNDNFVELFLSYLLSYRIYIISDYSLVEYNFKSVFKKYLIFFKRFNIFLLIF